MFIFNNKHHPPTQLFSSIPEGWKGPLAQLLWDEEEDEEGKEGEEEAEDKEESRCELTFWFHSSNPPLPFERERVRLKKRKKESAT